LLKDGKRQFAMIPYEELVDLVKRLAGAEDLL